MDKARKAIQQIVDGHHGENVPQFSRGTDRYTIIESVPARTVGLVIGRKGETINKMKQEFNCFIKVNTPMNDDSEKREVTITGNKTDVEACRERIRELVDGAGGGSSNRISAPQMQPHVDLSQGETYIIPQSMVGLLLRDHAHALQTAEKQAGAIINLSPNARPDGSQELRLSGSPSVMSEGKRIIEEIIKDRLPTPVAPQPQQFQNQYQPQYTPYYQPPMYQQQQIYNPSEAPYQAQPYAQAPQQQMYAPQQAQLYANPTQTNMYAPQTNGQAPGTQQSVAPGGVGTTQTKQQQAPGVVTQQQPGQTTFYQQTPYNPVQAQTTAQQPYNPAAAQTTTTTQQSLSQPPGIGGPPGISTSSTN
eukprot:UN34286